MSAFQEKPLGKAGFAAALPVSRETVERLELYLSLLERWQARINLVGPATLADPWRRHILDSAQLYARLPQGPVLDMGSGAGFPGLVLAVLRLGDGIEDPVHLAESDGRKCAFLSEVARQTGAKAVVRNRRVEAIDPFPAAAITARALAPLEKLLDLAEPFVTPATRLLFLKGKSGEEELTGLAKGWRMTAERVGSLSDPAGMVLHLKGVSRGRD